MPGIRITATSMHSPATPHTATATGERWQVSWLPGRILTRNQAVTAMVIAYTVAGGAIRDSDDRIWPHLDNWRASWAPVRRAAPCSRRSTFILAWR
jgi:hypothetical protein